MAVYTIFLLVAQWILPGKTQNSARVKDLTGGAISCRPQKGQADRRPLVHALSDSYLLSRARAAFKRNVKDTSNIDLHLDVATACIRILENNLARGRKLGVHPPMCVRWCV